MTSHISSDSIMQVYNQLLKIYKKIKQDNEITIDFNLFNFIVRDNGKNLVFVDVTPPLYLDNVNKLDDRFKSQKDLFTNKPLQLISFSMYFMMPFIIKDTPKEELKMLYLKMLVQLKKNGLMQDYNQQYDHIFCERKQLFENYLNSDIDNFKQQFLSFDIKNDLNSVGENLWEM